MELSINRDMRDYTLEHKDVVRTESGAEDYEWNPVGTVKAAVYKKNDMSIVTSEKYLESTHTGLTRCRKIIADEYRLVRDGICYLVTDCNPDGRLTNLLLKVVK